MEEFTSIIKTSNEENDQISKYMNKKNDEISSSLREIVQFLLKAANNKIIDDLKKYEPIYSEIVYFNVGGSSFSTYKSNLIKKRKENDPYYNSSSYFKALVDGLIKINYNNKNEIFIDRSPKYFDLILDYLRTLNTNETFELPQNSEILEGFYKEVDFYMLDELKDLMFPFHSSSILNFDQRKKLLKLTGFDMYKKWELLYRGSLHGFRAKDFHEKCDGVAKTLTLVKSNNSNIFGGYTEAQWDSSGVTKSDPKAFLFSLENKEKQPIKINIKNGVAIFCNSILGPTFGYEHKYRSYHDRYGNYRQGNSIIYDLSISDQSNLNHDSFSSLESSYPYDLNKYVLANSEYFLVEDIEVYKSV